MKTDRFEEEFNPFYYFSHKDKVLELISVMLRRIHLMISERSQDYKVFRPNDYPAFVLGEISGYLRGLHEAGIIKEFINVTYDETVNSCLFKNKQGEVVLSYELRKLF